LPRPTKPVIRERLRQYDFVFHAKTGDHHNKHLFDDHPDIGEYLLTRMALVGTPEQCAKRVEDLIRDAELDGFWVPLIPSDGAPGSEQLDRRRRAGEAFAYLSAEL
jgi:alkanesulfonate monooxygenase SsuD/methylene tetrahydromethanopterin reductase-like flavin-dependent oxidoreductase (luciferase family)